MNNHNVSAFNKIGMNWAVKNKQAMGGIKDSKNYRSMSSLMKKKQAEPKKHQISIKSKHATNTANIERSFMSRYKAEGSAVRKQSIASNRSIGSRCRNSSQTSKNSSVTRRYQLKSKNCSSFALLTYVK